MPDNHPTLDPCPFCGGAATLDVCDAEGNVKDAAYETDPWSGLSYTFQHNDVDNPTCPIAHDVDYHIGTLLYESREEAATAWNTRFDPIRKEQTQ